MANSILILREHPKSDYAARLLRKRARTFLEILDLHDVELSITLVDDAAITQMNGKWRGKPHPTDVLSFPAGEMPSIPGQPRPLGDVVISLDTAQRYADEAGTSLSLELSRYLAHGLLHLMGRDHQTAKEAQKMSRDEEMLLRGIGNGMLLNSPEIK